MSASTVVSSALLASVVLDPGIYDPLQYCNGKHVAEALHREAGRRRDRSFKAERRDVRCQGGENHADAGFVLPACGGNAATTDQSDRINVDVKLSKCPRRGLWSRKSRFQMF